MDSGIDNASVSRRRSAAVVYISMVSCSPWVAIIRHEQEQSSLVGLLPASPKLGDLQAAIRGGCNKSLGK